MWGYGLLVYVGKLKLFRLAVWARALYRRAAGQLSLPSLYGAKVGAVWCAGLKAVLS